MRDDFNVFAVTLSRCASLFQKGFSSTVSSHNDCRDRNQSGEKFLHFECQTGLWAPSRPAPSHTYYNKCLQLTTRRKECGFSAPLLQLTYSVVLSSHLFLYSLPFCSQSVEHVEYLASVSAPFFSPLPSHEFAKAEIEGNPNWGQKGGLEQLFNLGQTCSPASLSLHQSILDGPLNV